MVFIVDSVTKFLASCFDFSGLLYPVYFLPRFYGPFHHILNSIPDSVGVFTLVHLPRKCYTSAYREKLTREMGKSEVKFGFRKGGFCKKVRRRKKMNNPFEMC
jgi:hypothetical protein